MVRLYNLWHAISNLVFLAGGTILAFGDSLTQGLGYRSVGTDKRHSFHPYALALRELLPHTNVIESGVSGERVEGMRKRLQVEVQRGVAENTLTTPLVVVILGGTNNIGMHFSAASTATDLLGMHDDLRSLHTQLRPHLNLRHGNSSSLLVRTVAVTLPSFPHDHLRESRVELNAMLREYASQSGGFTSLLDIEDLFMMEPCKHSHSSSSHAREQDPKCRDNIIPYDPDNRRYWDSQSPLHFSELGYDALGRIVFERLCSDKSYFTQ